MDATLTQQHVPHRLATRITALQEPFRKLSKAATQKDLVEQFTIVLNHLFPNSHIDILHRIGLSEQWQILHKGHAESVEHLLMIPDEIGSCSCDIHKAQMSAVQRLADRSLVGVVLTRHRKRESYTGDDMVLQRLLMQLFDSAYQSILNRRKEKELIFSLNHRVLQLNSLIDTGIEVSKLDHGVSLKQLALERAAALTNASTGLVRVTNKKRIKEETLFPAGAGAQKAIDKGHHIRSSFRFGGNTYTFELFNKESRHGVLPFEETDQVLLDALARQVHASLENRYLHEQALEKQKIEQELSVAASIQQRILPKALPTIEGFDLAGTNIPSKSVGGDYFDCIPLPDGRIALVVADVSGKGVPAALLVSSFHAYLAAYLEGPVSLVQLTQKLNSAILKAATSDKFITAFLALLDPKTGKLESLSAGHNPMYIIRKDGTLEEFNTGGVALGMLDMEFPYQTDETTLQSGDRLLLYTDGVTEAINERGELYDTIVSLRRFVRENMPRDAKEFINELIASIKHFVGSAPQVDDITALYLMHL